MQKLNLPEYKFKVKKCDNGKDYIFDELRKKYVSLTPEEYVRQNFIRYLISEKNYPGGLMASEIKVNVNGLSQRCDIVCFKKDGSPAVIVECKAPQVKITEKVFNQAARYNMSLHTDYLIMTNGISHYCCKVDYNALKVHYLKEIPDYKLL